MKTIFLSIAAALFITASTATSTFANTKTNGIETLVTEVSTFNQIEVHGNVEVYVTTGAANNVKVYDGYYGKNSLVQEQNGVLRISSFKTEKLVVWVTVADLRSISAYDNASVKSFGKLSAIELSVKLNNNASAQLDLDVDNATVTLNDNSRARFSGFANESNIQISQSANINTAKFTAVKGSKQYMSMVSAVATSAAADELTIIE